MRLLFILALVMFSLEGMASTAVSKILVLKSERKMYLVSDAGDYVKEYKVALGFAPEGHKEEQGDGKTPEGTYRITWKNPKSAYYKALRISYPDAKDNGLAKKRGVNPGGDIVVHGLPNGYGYIGKAHLLKDWTLGCIAVTNEEMDEIWELVEAGTPIEIKP